MTYMAKEYKGLTGVAGLSDTLLNNHFTLYNGYVTNTNKLLDALNKIITEGNPAGPEFAEMKRRLGWEFNGMRLHELYFENLGGTEAPGTDSLLSNRLVASFGSIQAWEADFRATGLMRGIGWVGLYQDPGDGRLINFWINEHDVANPAGCQPLLIMDVFEHAYMLDYGLKRADYVNAFLASINWQVVESRLILTTACG